MCATKERRQREAKEEDCDTAVGVLGEANDGGSDRNAGNDGSGNEGDSGKGGRPAKRACVAQKSQNSNPALALLHKAMEAIPTPKLFLECCRFLRLRIQRLLVNNNQSGDDNKVEEEESVSHCIGDEEDSKVAAHRHANLLKELNQNSKKRGVSSANLTLDHVDFLLSKGQPKKVEELVGNAVSTSVAADATGKSRLWLQWAEIS